MTKDKKQKGKKIKVYWAFGNPVYYQFDFGRFEGHEANMIEVNKDFWDRYCDVRFEFEVMQKELMGKVSVRGRDSITPSKKLKRKATLSDRDSR